MSKLTSFEEGILSCCPTVKPGISTYEIMERLDAGVNHEEYTQGIKDLEASGYLCKDSQRETYWREPERVVVLRYLEQYKTISSLDVTVDDYVAMQLGINQSIAHGLLLKALRKLVRDGLVVGKWAETGKDGPDEMGVKRYRVYALKSWLEG